LTLGPRVGIVTEESIRSATHTDIWVQVASQYTIPVGERWRPAISLEIACAPERLADPVHEASLPPFPTWSSSLRIGIVGDVP
jgi:hypothetical protein